MEGDNNQGVGRLGMETYDDFTTCHQLGEHTAEVKIDSRKDQNQHH